MRRLDSFWFPSTTDSWLTLLRVGSGLQVLFYCLTSWRDWRSLFRDDGSGLGGRAISELFLSGRTALTPRLSWIIDAAALLHLNEDIVLRLLGIILFLAALCVCLGFFSRESAMLAWFIHLASVKSAGLTSYGMDNFTTIALFYLMIAPLPDRWSLDAIARRVPVKDPALHGFHRRILQLHLCIIYFSSGLTKALGPAWWNGESVWRALIRPPFNLIPAGVLVHVSSLLPAFGITVLVLELGYPVFIWSRHTRQLWLVAIVAMHVGIAVTMGLYLFSLIMITLNVTAFAPGLRWSPRKTVAEERGRDWTRPRVSVPAP